MVLVNLILFWPIKSGEAYSWYHEHQKNVKFGFEFSMPLYLDNY